MTKIPLSILSTLILATTAARSEPAQVVTHGNIANCVRAQNPQLQAARHLIDEAIGRMRQSGRLENPQLEIEIEQNERFIEGRFGVGLSQRFPLTQRLKLEKELGAAAVEVARAEIREVENQLAGDAKAALVRVLTARERLKLIEQQSALATELAEVITKAADKGEASVLDAGQAKLASLQYASEKRRLAVQEQQAVAEVKPLLGMRPGAALVVSGGLPGLQLPVSDDASVRPALELARLAQVAVGTEVELEQAKRYDDVKAGFFAATERSIDAPEGAEREEMIGVMFMVPLPWWNRNEGNIDAANAKVKRRAAESEALQRNVALDAEAARSEMAEWAKLAAEIEKNLLPQADEQVELAEQAWHDGQGDLVTVLRSREQRLELAAARLDAVENFHLARVRHQTAVGRN